jgi:hypothetical protein
VLWTEALGPLAGRASGGDALLELRHPDLVQEEGVEIPGAEVDHDVLS